MCPRFLWDALEADLGKFYEIVPDPVVSSEGTVLVSCAPRLCKFESLWPNFVALNLAPIGLTGGH